MSGTCQGTVLWVGLGVINLWGQKASDGAVAHKVVDAVVNSEREGGEEIEAADVEVTEGATARHQFVFV